MLPQQPIEIRQLTLEDMDDIVRLHDIYLNYGAGIRPHYEAMLRDPETVACKAVTPDGAMVGLAIYVPGISFSGGHPELCDMVHQRVGEAKTYTGDALLVVQEYRRQGIDARMLAYIRQGMLQRGVVYVVAELWVHPDGKVPGKRIPATLGEVIDLGLYHNFYCDFDHYGYLCPICGEKCVCSAHLYLSRLCGENKEAHPDENT